MISDRPTELSRLLSRWGGQWQRQRQLPRDLKCRKETAGPNPEVPLQGGAAVHAHLVLAHPLGGTDIVSYPLFVFQADPRKVALRDT